MTVIIYILGVNAKEEIEWKVDGKAPPFIVAPYHSDGNFSFLYSRESDVIGSKVPKTIVEEKKVLTKTEFLKKKREMVEATNSLEGTATIAEETKSRSAEDILNVYKHEPKYEDPRYTTSNVSVITSKYLIHFSFSCIYYHLMYLLFYVLNNILIAV